MIRCDRSFGGGGGVALIIRNSIKFKVIEQNSSLDNETIYFKSKRLNEEITLAEIKEAIKDTKAKNSSGHDKISDRVIKNLSQQFLK
ncbi:unnamed protein product, partial [Brachionus calyciflorus]